jgi:hypothetical protein
MYTVYQRKITRAMNSLGFEGEACELKCTAYKVHLNFLQKRRIRFGEMTLLQLGTASDNFFSNISLMDGVECLRETCIAAAAAAQP